MPDKPRVVGAIELEKNEPVIEELQSRVTYQLSNGNTKGKKNLKKKIKNLQKKIELKSRANKNFTLFTQYRSIVNLSIACGKRRESELVSFFLYMLFDSSLGAH